MADVSLKRRHPGDEELNAQKRTRSNNGPPMPSNNGSAPNGQVDIDRMLAEARAKAEAVRARINMARGDSASASPSPAPPATSTGTAMSRIEQMRARVAAATGKVGAATTQQRPSFTPSPVAPTSIEPPNRYDDDDLSKARGGLGVGLHPALLADTIQDQRGTKGRGAAQPKFATTMANRRSTTPVSKKPGLDLSGPSLEEIKQNPYYDDSLHATSKPRLSKQLVFNQKGKYIAQAAALRRQAQMEEMKKRIASMARQAGVDEELSLEKAFEVPAPPALEWWDEGLVNGSDYSAIDDPKNIKVDTDDSLVTIYIQHPVLLDPPQEKLIPQQKPMYLTAKEQAKLRRQRRMADLKEQQAKIRLGLEPAPPPKVKKSNLMRVLGEEAVKDPTAVEARVNREIAERRQKHESANEERKLTKEQRKEKLAAQQEKDAEKGIHVCVFKIDCLANGRHRFKISKNAEQMALTGVCVMHPKLNLLIVEGGAHSINQYKKLMLNRIDWTENSGPGPQREGGNRESSASWLNPEDEKGELRDLGSNTCTLLWEGQQKTRAFRKWLGARVCETDSAAKDTLARAKMENFWVLAKTYKPAAF
ncbi:U4/U6 small nuclear ribonucleoprotein, putative [Talaromyces stipitatus ATCC 10500]|uniref:U4/U6 small nuclear ribonucleoprotein, putative n=1 Tax=Talaromyces stipitatus (strain ATCC 10500 / CBS 375.48 / QM 6759 / NRRL 1006) TaxID=441959 RepID=B8M0T4_TALSN|nr:U4/U6 small nuclear ribonucleoprotein, putative [Talaromyces stipitatus ATCC 10500]EED21467.1 U4/U6 small nuclear ribonucleoprotein, putative [Talaromyces stipitatus ATCC 10500]